VYNEVVANATCIKNARSTWHGEETMFKNLKGIVKITLCVAGPLLVGCASSNSASPAVMSSRGGEPTAEKASHAECLVCKKNADMACVDVDVDGKTPVTEYNGKKYYFCSDECRTEFQKNPAKFTSAK
jgi:YHS domain-containing protein